MNQRVCPALLLVSTSFILSQYRSPLTLVYASPHNTKHTACTSLIFNSLVQKQKIKNIKNRTHPTFQAGRYVTDLAPAHNIMHQLVTTPISPSGFPMVNSETIFQANRFYCLYACWHESKDMPQQKRQSRPCHKSVGDIFQSSSVCLGLHQPHAHYESGSCTKKIAVSLCGNILPKSLTLMENSSRL